MNVLRRANTQMVISPKKVVEVFIEYTHVSHGQAIHGGCVA